MTGSAWTVPWFCHDRGWSCQNRGLRQDRSFGYAAQVSPTTAYAAVPRRVEARTLRARLERAALDRAREPLASALPRFRPRGSAGVSSVSRRWWK